MSILTDSLILTENEEANDMPLWKYESHSAEEDDRLYQLGAHLIYWEKNKSGLFVPRIIYPIDYGLLASSEHSLEVHDPGTLIFAPGKTLDVLLQRIPDLPGKMKVYTIKDGAIVSAEIYDIKGDLNIQLYADKYLLVLTNQNLQIMNIQYPQSVTIVDGVPPDGTMAVLDDLAVIWSRQTNQRVVVHLDTKRVDAPINFTPSLDLEDAIRKVSIQNMLTVSAKYVKLYDSSGKQIFMRQIGNGSNYRYEGEGVIDAHHCEFISFSLINTLTTERHIFFVVGGVVKEKILGRLNARGLLAFKDKVYVSMSTIQLQDIATLSVFIPDTKRVYNVLGEGHYFVHRYLRISPTGNWVLERSNLSGKKELTLRPVFGRVLNPTISIKSRLPKNGPVVTNDDLVLPYLYSTGSTIRVWTCEISREPPGTNQLREPRNYTLKFWTWDKIKETLEPTGIDYRLLILPPPGFIARWYKTDEWVVLFLGKIAYAFTLDGRNVTPIEIPEMEIKPDQPVHIVTVRGYGRSLWFLLGYPEEGHNLIWQAYVWDGAVDSAQFVFPEPIQLANAVATGLRNRKNSGRRILQYELILSQADPKKSWQRVIYIPDAKKTGYSEFHRVGRRGVLCSNTDQEGRVYFSKGNELFVHIPGVGILNDFSTIYNVTFNMDMPVRPGGGEIRSIRVGSRKVWIATGIMFYCIETNIVQPEFVKERELASRPVLSFSLQKYIEEFQGASSIHTYPSIVDNRDAEAIFENDAYMWISRKPKCLHVRADPLKKQRIPSIVILEPGRMLVLSNYIEEQESQRDVQEKEHTLPTERTGRTKQLTSVLCEVLI